MSRGDRKALAAGSGLRKAGRWGSLCATAVFALYNGALGAVHGTLWHGSICLYYVLLSLLRGLLLTAEGREERGVVSARRKRGLFFGSWGRMLVMNVALTVPAALMVQSRRPVSMGMIPAITSATYTTYKITAAVLGLRERVEGVFAREGKGLRLVDALVSVLVLQNTLITVVDGEVRGEMRLLSAASSVGIFLLIFGEVFLLHRRGRKMLGTGERM